MSYSFASKFAARQICTFRIIPSASSALHQTRHRLLSSSNSIVHNATRVPTKRPVSLFFKAAGVASIGIGISAYRKPIHCDVSDSTLPSGQNPQHLPPPPASSLSLYELSFGTVTGICAGVFIKKGAKAVAWFLGGIFVLLQYLGSASLIRVDWKRMGSKFENMFYTVDASGMTRGPTIGSAWRWLVDFLTADFQPRASFIAGLALGLRIG